MNRGDEAYRRVQRAARAGDYDAAVRLVELQHQGRGPVWDRAELKKRLIVAKLRKANSISETNDKPRLNRKVPLRLVGKGLLRLNARARTQALIEGTGPPTEGQGVIGHGGTSDSGKCSIFLLARVGDLTFFNIATSRCHTGNALPSPGRFWPELGPRFKGTGRTRGWSIPDVWDVDPANAMKLARWARTTGHEKIKAGIASESWGTGPNVIIRPDEAAALAETYGLPSEPDNEPLVYQLWREAYRVGRSWYWAQRNLDREHPWAVCCGRGFGGGTICMPNQNASGEEFGWGRVPGPPDEAQPLYLGNPYLRVLA